MWNYYPAISYFYAPILRDNNVFNPKFMEQLIHTISNEKIVKPIPNPPTIAGDPIYDVIQIVDKLVATQPKRYNIFGIDLKINFIVSNI